ncbi:MAG: DUF6766 family protein [Daejeonella sp.]
MKNQAKRSFLYRNGLSIVFLGLFFIFLIGQALTGWKEHNHELLDENAGQIDLSTYLRSGHFIQATFENWESEFLQMCMYVFLTVSLRQIGSAESKKLDEEEKVDREPKPHKAAPWPVRKGGWILKIYKNSLSFVFLLLFLISFALHAMGSCKDHNIEQRIKNKPEVTLSEYLFSSRLWFESFQNWQSEFLSVASIVILSIYLRQKGSPESKPVDAPIWETGK